MRARKVAMDDAGAARVRAIGPATVARAVLLRVAEHPEATALVRAAAILGDGATLGEAAALVGLDQQDAARAADQLITLAILTPAPQLEFAHPIVREAVYADIGTPRARPGARARGADPDLRGADRSADRAGRAGGRRVAGRAAAAGRRRRAPARSARGRDRLATARERRAVRAARGCEQGLLLEAELASHAQQASPSTRSTRARAAAREAAARLWRHEQLKGETPGERLVLASLALERAKASESEYAAAERLADALAGGHLLREQKFDLAGPFYDLVVALLATDALAIVEADLELAVQEARARASAPLLAHLTCRRGWLALRRGDLTRAEGAASMALELLTNHGITLGLHFALALLVQTLVETGELDRAGAALEERALCAELRPGLTNNFLLEARALLRIAEGRTRDGLDDLLEFGRRDELWGGSEPARVALALAGRARVPGARRGRGGGRAGGARPRAGAPRGSASGLGVRLVALRANALIDGSHDGLREAVAAFARSPARLEHARALTDLGAALRRANRRAEAREALTEGLRLAERCAADPLAELARTELLAAGGRTARDGHGCRAPDGLASCASPSWPAGRSNPEIAQTLFVTRKTVETHLGHVSRKLDVSGRGDLARALAQSGS